MDFKVISNNGILVRGREVFDVYTVALSNGEKIPVEIKSGSNGRLPEMDDIIKSVSYRADSDWQEEFENFPGFINYKAAKAYYKDLKEVLLAAVS